jgi:RHS repeat-associated protein
LTKQAKPSGVTQWAWNAYGKVRQVPTATATMSFGYDAQQHRLKKTVTTGTTTTTRYYIRDAQGNALAVYERKRDSLIWVEQDLYGSSRLGMAKPQKLVTGAFATETVAVLAAGAKSYELSNHLGNVMAVISDRGVLLSAQDYYPFGMTMPGRGDTLAKKYRYGFNGKETDPETGIQDYGMRWYLPNIARFPSVDPLMSKYPWYTPYQFAGNKPIIATDLDGAEEEMGIFGAKMAEALEIMSANAATAQAASKQAQPTFILTYSIRTFDLTNRCAGGGDDKKATPVVFYFVKVEYEGYTRAFRCNMGSLTFCTDGIGPSHNSSGHNPNDPLASTLTDVNADNTPYMVTASPLLQGGASEYFSRGFMMGTNVYTGKIMESSGNVLESGKNHGMDECSIAQSRPWLEGSNLDIATFDVNKTNYERSNECILYGEQLGSAGNKKNWAPLSGPEFELARTMFGKIYDSMDALKTGNANFAPTGVSIRSCPFDLKEVQRWIQQANETKVDSRPD